MRYAIITDGVVSNIIALRSSNAADFPGAVALYDRPVGIGDTYTDGKFYRDGVEIMTAAEENATLRAALETLGVETEDAESPAE